MGELIWIRWLVYVLLRCVSFVSFVNFCVSLVLDVFFCFLELVFAMWRALTLKDSSLFKSPLSYTFLLPLFLVSHLLTQMPHVTPS